MENSRVDMRTALTIAGSDPGGGAGIQADLRTFHQFGVHGTSVVAVLTVQNTVKMTRSEAIAVRLVGEQIDAVLEDLPPAAVKTGALGNAEIVEAVASRVFAGPLVVDPVGVSKHGGKLGAIEAIRRLLIPKATLVTPNLDEAGMLTGAEVRDLDGMRDAARKIAEMGAKSVLVKGGHLEGDAIDLLYCDGAFSEFRSARIETRHTHGTGCVYSAAVTACLALGLSLPEAVGRAKRFVTEAIRTAPGLGHGAGPLNLFAVLEPR